MPSSNKNRKCRSCGRTMQRRRNSGAELILMGANPHGRRRRNQDLYDQFTVEERLALGRAGIGRKDITSEGDVREARKIIGEIGTMKNRLPNPMFAEADQAEAARELHADFHGEESKKYRAATEPHVPAGDYTQLGPFVSLAIKPTPSGTAYPKVMELSLPAKTLYVISAPKGYPFYIVGDSLVEPDEIRIFTDSYENRVLLGEGRVISYVDTKWGDDVDLKVRGEEIEYYHAFGEEGGTRPDIFYDRAMRRLILHGGSYRAEGSWMRD